MTKLKKEEVLHIAKLAKLDLSEAEIDKFTSQLSSVVDYFNDLNDIDTQDVKPTTQTTGLEGVYREDVVSNNESLTQDQAISGTDKNYNGYFKVDAILTERTDK